MRDAIADAFERITGKRPQFIFSGWSAELTEGERAVVENRAPRLCDVDRPHHYECKHCGIGPTTTTPETSVARIPVLPISADDEAIVAVCNRAAHLSDVPNRHGTDCPCFDCTKRYL